MTMKYSSGNGQPVSKIKGFRQFMTSIPRHVSENPGYIENNSGKNRIIQCDDMSVNGFMVTPYFSSTVYDGKKAIDDITLMSSELEENNITSIDEIELKFKIIDEDFMNSIESDTITFSAKQ